MKRSPYSRESQVMAEILRDWRNAAGLTQKQIGDLAFWNWVVEAQNGLVRRTEGSVLLLDENKREVLRWNFRRGWPCKWTGSGLNATNNEISMETLEICHEGLSIDGQAG